MIRKQIVIGLILLLLFQSNGLSASDYTGYSSDNNEVDRSETRIYENGFHHGINCIEREFQLYGKHDDTLKFKKYMVLMSIASLSRESILIYKNYAYEEGLVPVSIEYEKLVFKSFDREADAEYLANEILNKKYMGGQKKVVVKPNNPNQIYKRGKFIYSEIFDKMRENMEKEVQGKVFIVDGNYPYVSSTSYDNDSYAEETSLSDVEFSSNSHIVKKKKKVYSKKKKPMKKKVKIVQKKKRYFTVNDSKAEIFKYNKDNKLVSAGFIDRGSKYSYQKTQKIESIFYVRYKNNRFIELADVTRY
jgi:hypothetical protein